MKQRQNPMLITPSLMVAFSISAIMKSITSYVCYASLVLLLQKCRFEGKGTYSYRFYTIGDVNSTNAAKRECFITDST